MRKKHRYNKWKDGWEKIEPRWVLYSGVQPDYFQCVELKGKHYRYLICSEPRYQGDKRLIYYRKLRRGSSRVDRGNNHKIIRRGDRRSGR